MKTGDSASTTRTFDAKAIAGYEALSGAPNTGHGVPEPLIGGLFSYLLGAELPGYGTNYLKQTLDFVGTAEVGAPLTASVTITRIRPEKNLVDLATLCRDGESRTICEGRALVLVKDVGYRVSGAAAKRE
ncbi:MAG: phosphate acetyltransferase [Pseudomonadota bacterium]|uniref:hypothetical protein n=1 Tax=Fodinicurvata fenggangensis TaxID=1121830 RepID=UPI0005510BB4|nr:hypothetical protein [Fodinicurvata fenggangensis]